MENDRENHRSFETVENPHLDLKQPHPTDTPQYYFNPVRPSQTHALTRMLFNSSMTAVAFLLVSGLYAAQYLAAMLLESFDGTNVWEWIWMALVILPGLASLFPVVVCPKLFILRILRRWKRTLVRDYQDMLLGRHDGRCPEEEAMWSEKKRTEHTRNERKHWAELIDTVSNDRLNVRNYEILLAILNVLLNVAVIVVTVIAQGHPGNGGSGAGPLCHAGPARRSTHRWHGAARRG